MVLRFFGHTPSSCPSLSTTNISPWTYGAFPASSSPLAPGEAVAHSAFKHHQWYSDIFLDNLSYFWAAAPRSLSINSPHVASTHWCCHSERVCAFFTHTRALRTAEKTNSASQDRSRVPSPGESSSETHFSLFVFPQNTKEQIKTLKWFWFNFTVYYLCNQAKYFRLDGTKNCSFPNTFI